MPGQMEPSFLYKLKGPFSLLSQDRISESVLDFKDHLDNLIVNYQRPDSEFVPAEPDLLLTDRQSNCPRFSECKCVLDYKDRLESLIC